MSIVLKSVSATRNLLKFTQYANLFYSKREFSSLIRKKILPVNAAIRSPYSTAAEPSKIDDSEKPVPYRPKQKGSRYFKERDIVFLVEKVKNLKPLTYNQSCTLLKSCCQISYTEPPEVRMKLSNLVWETIKQSEVQLDIFHYNVLLSLYIDNEHKFSYEEFLCELESKGIEPNEITYRRLLKACCQQGNMPGATALLKKIQGGDMPVNESIFNTIIYGYCQANDINGALGVISLMDRKNMKTTSETYAHLLCAYARTGDIEEIKKVLSKCEELEIKIEDTQFLEVIYNLVVNGHEEHIDFIHQKIDRSYLYFPTALKIIYRIFYQKMDKAAFLVYNLVFREEKDNENEFFRQFFLDSLCKNKTPEEILTSCQSLFPPEALNAALSGILKKMLFEGNLKKIGNFLHEIQKTDFPVRPHYFWPLIIKASEHGNDEICKVLNLMNELGIKPCFETVDLVLKLFSFENPLNQDLALLGKYKILKRGILQILLLKFLERKQYEKALNLSLWKRFETPGLGLVNFLDKESAKYIAQIFYNLLHDDYLNSLNSGLLPEGDANVKTALEECSIKLNSFIENVVKKKPENVVLALLEELNKYPVRISQETVSVIKEKFPGSSKIEKVCEELSSLTKDDPIKLDEAVLKDKKSLALINYGLHKTFNHQKLSLAEKNFKDLGDAITVVDVITMITLYLGNKKVEKALELLEKLKTVERKNIPPKLLRNYCSSLIRELFIVGDEEASNKVLQVFKELGFYDEKSYCITYVKYLIDSGEINKAVDYYCDQIKKLHTKGYGLIVDTLIDTKKTELLEKVTNGLVKVVGKEALSLIFFKYVSKGYTKDAKKFFDTNNVIVHDASLSFTCNMFLKDENETGLLCLLEFADDFDIKRVLWRLLNLYVKKNEPEKIKNLNLIIQEKNILVGSKFHEAMNYFLDKIDQQLPITEPTYRKFKEKESKKHKLGTKNEIKKVDLVELIENGQLEVIMSQSEPGIVDKLRDACSKLINDKKSETYITFLEKAYEYETNPKLFNSLILMEEIFEHFTKDQLSKVLELATRSLEKKRFKPFKKILTGFLNKPQFLETFSNEIDEVFNEKIQDVKVILTSRIVDGFINNKELSQKTRSLGYSILIYTGTSYNLQKSVTYLEDAVKEGIGHLLNKKVLKLLRDEMEKKQMSFPHPDLLN